MTPYLSLSGGVGGIWCDILLLSKTHIDDQLLLEAIERKKLESRIRYYDRKAEKTQGRGPETVGQFQKKIRKIETGARRIFYAVKNGGSLWVKGKICRGLNGSCGFMKWFVSMSLFSFLMSVKKRFLSWTVSWLVGADEAEGFWGAAKYWVWCFLRCGGTLFLSGRSSLFF